MLFNDSFIAQLHNMSDSCGYTDYLNTYLKFPPPGLSPSQLPGADARGNTLEGCDVFDTIYSEVFYVNLCWGIYQVATTCPLLGISLAFLDLLDIFLLKLVYTSTEPMSRKLSTLRLQTGKNVRRLLCLSTALITALHRAWSFPQELSREANALLLATE